MKREDVIFRRFMREKIKCNTYYTTILSLTVLNLVALILGYNVYRMFSICFLILFYSIIIQVSIYIIKLFFMYEN